MKKYNNLIDIIIPAFNVEDKILFRCLSSIACQDIVSDIEITIIDDGSTTENYKEIIKNFTSIMKINLLRYEENKGPGVARQYGLDHTFNGFIVFIDADDTLNGSFSLKALRNNIELNNGLYIASVGIFDEVHEEGLKPGTGPLLMPHEKDMVWVFGKMYRRSFIDKYNIRFHETSRANEDNGFNTIIKLLSNEKEQINFIPVHVYYWHENLNSITRVNDCAYSFGSSIKDSFYGYIENMIYAIKEAKKRAPFNGNISAWSVNCMINIYEYYIECLERAPEHAEKNLEWCKKYYDEIYCFIEKDLPKEILSQQYNEIMQNAYLGNKLYGIIPTLNFFEFINKLK